MIMFCFSYLCGEYNPQTEGTMANVEVSWHSNVCTGLCVRIN